MFYIFGEHNVPQDLIPRASFTVICCLGCTTCCHSFYHSLSFNVTRCRSFHHLLSLVVIRCTTRCHSLCHSLSPVVTCYHSIHLFPVFFIFFNMLLAKFLLKTWDAEFDILWLFISFTSKQLLYAPWIGLLLWNLGVRY